MGSFQNFGDLRELPSDSNWTEIPSLSPPAGVKSSLDGAKSSIYLAYVAIVTVCLALITLFVGLRIYTKIRVLREFLIEDYSLVIAYCGALAWAGLSLATPGNGLHGWDVSVADYLIWTQWLSISLALSSPVVFLAKYSILTQLTRLFTKRRNVIWWMIQASIWIQLLSSVAFMLLTILQCVPRAAIGNPYIKGAHCVPLDVLVLPQSTVLLLSDVWIMLLPLLIIYKVQIASQRKFTIAVAFGLGALSVVCAALLIFFTFRAFRVGDLTYSLFPLALCFLGQLTALILAAAIPAVPVLLLSWRNIVIHESGPSEIGRIPSSLEERLDDLLRRKEFWSSSDADDFARKPRRIETTTEFRVTSARLDSDLSYSHQMAGVPQGWTA